jgi:flagellar basal-body rod protein FlgB
MIASEPVFALLGRAIDAAALRQAVHTANIANVDVEGYQRLEVALETELAAPEMDSAELAQPRIVPAADTAVKLDQEMALMAKNAVQYQALIGAFERMTSLLRLAAHDGREG